MSHRMRQLKQGVETGDTSEMWVSKGHVRKEARTQVLGSSTRLELLVRANDQQLVDTEGWKEVMKPGSRAEKRQTEQLGHRRWPRC